MNGLQAFKSIRSTNPILPVVILSGDEEKSVVKNFGDHQPNEILIKPVAGAALLQAIARWMSVPEEKRHPYSPAYIR
jgi:CheY-like chemotaxis protein